MERLLKSVLTATLLVTPASALAQPLTPPSELTALFSFHLSNSKPLDLIDIKPSKPAPKPEPIIYTVVEGDTLTKIGTDHNIEWQRLWAKNTQLTSPDLLTVGDKITIPFPDEQLARDIPQAIVMPDTTPGVAPLRYGGSVQAIGGLIGSIGYARAGGNCVNEPGVNNPHDGTNPISWAVLSYTPSIGATVLWAGINHTGVITGIWSNGDIEVRHQNWSGAPITRFSRSNFRGFR